MATGADLEIGTLLEAYRSGYFPMPLTGRSLGWFSPDPRGVLLPGGLKISRSLRRSMSRYSVSFDEAFGRVITECANPRRPHGWIDRRIARAYLALHEAGLAHSIETWDGDELVGGLYGVSIGGLFAGESMFHHKRDASKVALVHLSRFLGVTGSQLAPTAIIDVQWATPHLESLGVVEVPRLTYGQLLAAAVSQTDSCWPRGQPTI